jgi:GT2 family glycosyltransferase
MLSSSTSPVEAFHGQLCISLLEFEMEQAKLAVILTSHNRRAKTLACLEALFGQIDGESVVVHVYLADSGSTDGTPEAVIGNFPQVKLMSCNNDIYWCGGMRIAWTEAINRSYDYYLLMNDDTVLLPNAVKIFLELARTVRAKEGRDGIIVGSTLDPVTKKRSYGGVVRRGKNGDVTPTDELQLCDQMSCNCTLVPHQVAELIGNLSPEYTHALADHDYSLRAKAKGFSVWVAPGYLGVCSSNPIPLWENPKVPLRVRLKALHSPTGLPPREWVIFCRRHLPFQWPLRLILLYLHVIFPQLWLKKSHTLSNRPS